MDKINREDMLELTRRMTLKRNCFGRVAGGYYDEDGNLEDFFTCAFSKSSDTGSEDAVRDCKKHSVCKNKRTVKGTSFYRDRKEQQCMENNDAIDPM